MSKFLTKPWIGEATFCEREEDLPKKVKAYIVKIEEKCDDGEHVALIADKDLLIKAKFTEEAVLTFLSDDSYEEMTEIAGGLVVITNYKIIPNFKDINNKEFIVIIKDFKLFGTGLHIEDLAETHSSYNPSIRNRLVYLWERDQLIKLCERYIPSCPNQATDQQGPYELLDQLSKVHLNVCHFNQDSFEKDEPPILLNRPSINYSVIESSCPEPFFADNLNHGNFEPLLLDCSNSQLTFNHSTQSQNRFSEDELCPVSQTSFQGNQSLSMLIDLCDAHLNEPQIQENHTEVVRGREQLLPVGSSCSSGSSRSTQKEDLMEFIKRYWVMRYRELQNRKHFGTNE